MYLVAKHRGGFYFFFSSTVFNNYGYFQGMFGGALVSPFYGGTISKTSAYSKTYMLIAGNTIIGRVVTQPTMKRKIRFYPCMRSTFATQLLPFGQI